MTEHPKMCPIFFIVPRSPMNEARGLENFDDKIKGLFSITQAAAACGLSRSTLMRMEEKGLLTILEDKLSLLQRNVEELRIRSMTNSDMSVQIMTLPETVCCTRRCTLLTVQEKYDAMYDFFHECIENEYVLAQEPLFIVNERTDYLYGDYNRLDEA